MSFKQTGKIGRPGPSEKYKIPGGYRLFSVSFGGTLNVITDGDPDDDPIFTMNDSFGVYNGGEVIVSFNGAEMRTATSEWSTGGDNWTISPAYGVLTGSFDGAGISNPQPVIESASCAEVDQEIASSILPPKLYTNVDGQVPKIRMNFQENNRATVFTRCFLEKKCSAMILINFDFVEQFNPGNVASIKEIK